MGSDNHLDIVFGRRPVMEALEAGSVSKLLFTRGAHGSIVKELQGLAREKKVPFHWVDRRKLDQMTKGNHQGVLAYVSAIEMQAYPSLLEDALSSSSQNASLIFLDGIQDPQNVGSILRTAVYMGVYGVVVPKWRAAPLTSAVVRASAGAARLIPVTQVSNMTTAMALARKKGLWLVGADMEGEDIRKAKIPRPFGLVMGSEGEGLHRLVRENCDYLVSIPGAATRQGVDSLNVSIACGILLHQL